MCGRFYVDELVWSEIQKICRRIDAVSQEIPSGDVYPSGEAVILMGEEGRLTAGKARWGYEISGRSQVMFNARSETVKERPMFARDYQEHRCVVPAGKFYEWKKTGMGDKTKYEFAMESEPLFLAGIWRRDPQGERFTILTTQANDSMKGIHDRMPLILKKNEIQGWIFSREEADCLLKQTPPLLKKRPSGPAPEYEQMSLF